MEGGDKNIMWKEESIEDKGWYVWFRFIPTRGYSYRYILRSRVWWPASRPRLKQPGRLGSKR